MADEIPVSDVANATQGTDAAQDMLDVPVAVKPSGEVEAPGEREIAEAVQNSIMDGLYIKDGAAYAIYYFYQPGADTYAAAANSLAEQLDGISQVYSILVPSSIVVLPDEEGASVGGSDQRQVLDYIWSRLDERVVNVDLLETMKAHRDEYIYFRTDHHWTMKGAYFGYVEYCRAKGLTPEPLDSFPKLECGPFNGSYYESIAAIGTPATDDFVSYEPHDTNTMTWWDSDGSESLDAIVGNASGWDEWSKYDSLLGADDPRQLIDNPNINDGSSCLVIKDSYGCAFVPFLVGHYDKIHVIDPRYYYGSVTAYARDNQIDDVLLVYGVKVGLAQKYAELLYASVAG